MIVVERFGNRIRLKSPWSPEMPERCKRVAGASWAKTYKAWTYPLTLTTCRDLRAEFGEDLTIGPELTAWAREQVALEKAMTPLAASTDATLLRVPQVAPRLAAAMENRPYQKPAARFIALGQNVMVADQPGLGKTLEALGGLIEAGVEGPFLVAAPKTSLDLVWRREILRWTDAQVYVAPEGRAKRAEALAAFAADANPNRWLVINAEMARTIEHEECKIECGDDKCGHDKIKWFEHTYPELFDTTWGAVVVDEGDRYLINVRRTQVGVGMKMLNVREDGLRLALTGTPMHGKPKNLWGLLHWLRPEEYSSFWTFAKSFLTVEDNGYGHDIGDVRPDREEALKAALSTVMLRRTKAEVLTDLPPKTYAGTLLDPEDPNSPVGVWMEMSGEQARIYRDMVKHGAADMAGGNLIANGVLAELTRYSQLANSAGQMVAGEFRPALPSNKFDWIVAALDERGIRATGSEGDSKVVIASQYTQLINLYAAELAAMGIGCYVLTGDTSSKERERQVKEFQSDQTHTRVFLLNTKAGGVAITLDAADDLFMVDETWVPDDQEQVEDRLHRASRMHSVTIYYLRTLGTVDEGRARAVAAKENVQKKILDGSRGVTYMRRLINGGR